MTTTAPKKMPIPVRLDEPEDAAARGIAQRTGLSLSEVLRRACRFALPKFVTGEVEISTVAPTPQK